MSCRKAGNGKVYSHLLQSLFQILKANGSDAVPLKQCILVRYLYLCVHACRFKHVPVIAKCVHDVCLCVCVHACINLKQTSNDRITVVFVYICTCKCSLFNDERGVHVAV